MTLKNLLLLLIVANIGLALWQISRTQLTAVDAPMPTIALASEAEQPTPQKQETPPPAPPAVATKPAVTPAPAVPQSKPPPAKPAKTVAKPTVKPTPKPTKKPIVAAQAACFSYGPFAKKTVAEQTAKKLRAQNATVTLVSKEEKRKTGTAVQLIALDEVDFSQLKRDLSTFNIKDWSLVRRDGERFIISVGVFSIKAHLDARLDQMTYLDRDPLTVDFHKTTTQYQVVAKTTGSQPLKPKSKKIPCKTIAQKR